MDDEELEVIEEPIESDVGASDYAVPHKQINRNSNVPNALIRRNLNNKSNDKLSNKKNPSNLESNNSTPERLQKGNNDKAKSIPNNLKAKLTKKMPLLPSRKKSNSGSNAVNSGATHENRNENTDENTGEISSKEKTTISIKKVKIIVIGIIIAAVAFLCVVIFGAIVSIFGWMFDLVSTFNNVGNSNYDSFLDTESDNYQDAVKYYEALNQSTTKFEESCGITLNGDYIHSVLIYKYKNLTANNNKTESQIFQEMKSKIDTVANLMVSNCVVDYEIGGSFYLKLRDSVFLKEYYEDELEYMDKDQLTTEIFEYVTTAAELSQLFGSSYIYDDLQVTMGTCEYPYTNTLLNEGTSYPSTVGFSDYIMGAIYGEMEGSIKEENKEFLKAFTIVTTSYVLNRSGYETGDTEIFAHNGNCWQLSCNIEYGCHHVATGDFNTTFTGPNSNGRYYKDPMNEEQKRVLSEVFEEVFGTVILTNDGKIKWAAHKNSITTSGCETDCLGQIDALNDSKNGMDYVSILNKYYDNITLSNMLEDSYIGDISYDEGGYSGNVVFYDQTDYAERFCGKTNSTISSSGCGVTSMAIVLSTFVDRSYTPPVVMEDAYSMGYCGNSISGTNAGFFSKAAAKYNLGYHSVGKRGILSIVTSALESGNSLVIAHMGPGTFTRSGHYIVLTRVNSNGKVYVLDPNGGNKNGWYDFNLIVKELKGQFHIITRRG